MQLQLAVIIKKITYIILSSTSKNTSSYAWQENKIIKSSRYVLVYFVFSLFSNIAAAKAVESGIVTAVKTTTQLNKKSNTSNQALISPLEKQQPCYSKQASIRFKPQTIFDENEQGIIFLHRWANAIHIDTKIMTLENEASFFLQKCTKTVADMAELERHLRSRKYLRDASVTSDDTMENITVTTWDNWSLMPTLSFGRKGGVNTYSFGIKERNLLGLGIDTEIESYRNSQRSGYKLQANIPLFQKQNTSAEFKFSDNDDGQQTRLFLHKIFAGADTKSAYKIGFNEEDRNDTIFQNGTDQSIYRHEISYKEINYAWLKFNDDKRLLRYSIGITQDKDIFSSLSPAEIAALDSPPLTDQLPEDRNLLYPWIAFEYIEKDFRKLTNVRLITQIEDFNHGLQINSRFGLGNGSKKNAAWAIWQLTVKKGFNLHNNALLLLDLSLANDIYQERESRFILKLTSEYFYQLNKNWGFYLGNVNMTSKNQYLDQPITLGGTTGVRGFPIQYQHGQSSIKLTSEMRYYPHINLFKLVDLAGVAFVDAGRAYGVSTVKNIETDWLASAGLGLRLHSPHSGGNNSIIHIDFAFPQSDNEEINNFEIRVQAKKSF
ncbi:BamA/TamA family outer membrane protein [Colwelliaceae bacterium MEBiC 14330]